MKYISLFSGIEAASMAFTPLGWKPVAFSEIEPFPCAVLNHHYPDVPNLGDITKVDWRKYRGHADLVCGGSPCQSFSIAGLHGGMLDERGNLALTYVRAVAAIRPKWIVYENVPGMFSAPGNPFGCILAGLSGASAPLVPGTKDGKWRSAGIVSGPGYGLAWRILNAEFFGVAQQRKRIFVVGYLGDWRRAAQVLFNSKMLRGDITAGGTEGQEVAGKSGIIIEANRRQNKNGIICMATGQGGAEIMEDKAPTLNCNHEAPIVCGNLPLVMAFKQRPGGDIIQSEKAYTISTTSNASAANTAKIQQGASVRRLTCTEVESAQGFPRNYTKIPYRGKTADMCPDSPRYKSIGNSWAVPCARWIGERIQAMEGIK